MGLMGERYGVSTPEGPEIICFFFVSDETTHHCLSLSRHSWLYVQDSSIIRYFLEDTLTIEICLRKISNVNKFLIEIEGIS